MGARLDDPRFSADFRHVRPWQALLRFLTTAFRPLASFVAGFVVMAMALGFGGGVWVPAAFCNEAEESVDPLTSATTCQARSMRAMNEVPLAEAPSASPRTSSVARGSSSAAVYAPQGHRLANGLLAPLRR